MTWLDDLFGGKSKKNDADALRRQTDAYAGQNYAEQQRILSQGTDAARANYGAGYDVSTRNILDAYNKSSGQLDSGYDRAIGATRDYGQRAVDYLTPFINQGRTAQAYNNYLGTGEGGAGAQTTFRSAMNQRLTDENREALDYEAKQRASAANAGRAGLNSGRSALVDARATTQALSGLRENEASRLEAQGAREAGYATRAGDMTQRMGDSIAGYEQGRGTAQAGLTTGYGNNQAQLAGSYYGSLAGLDMSRAGALSGATNDYYGNLAGSAQRQSDAYSATRGTGMNNLAQWGGPALQGFTPGRMGTSAFGNIKNTLWGKGLS